MTFIESSTGVRVLFSRKKKKSYLTSPPNRYQAFQYPLQQQRGDQTMRLWRLWRTHQLYSKYVRRHLDIHERERVLFFLLHHLTRCSQNEFKEQNIPSNQTYGRWESASSNSPMVVFLFRDLPKTTTMTTIWKTPTPSPQSRNLNST